MTLTIELLHQLPRDMAATGAAIAWTVDQPSPFGDEGSPFSCQAVLAGPAGWASGAGPADRYTAEMVVGKDGSAGAISLMALIERPEGMSRAEAFRHWDEHIPLAVEVHYKALSYRQYRFVERLSKGGRDYTGLAVLGFASPEDLRTGLFRTPEDNAVIAADVAEFTTRFETLYGTEHRLCPTHIPAGVTK